MGLLLQGSTKPEDGRYLLVVGLAFAGTLVLWWWSAAADRWRAIILLNFARMYQIENETDFRSIHLTELHDKTDLQAASLPPADAELRAWLRRVTGGSERDTRNVHRLRKLLDICVPTLWMYFIAVEGLSQALVDAQMKQRPCFSANASCLLMPPASIIQFALMTALPAAVMYGLRRALLHQTRDS